MAATPRTMMASTAGAPSPRVAAAGAAAFATSCLGAAPGCRARIGEFDPQAGFVDVQVRGPWAHGADRDRSAAAAGAAWVENRAASQRPLRPLAHAAHALVV